jgi:hypothetical protein
MLNGTHHQQISRKMRMNAMTYDPCSLGVVLLLGPPSTYRLDEVTKLPLLSPSPGLLPLGLLLLPLQELPEHAVAEEALVTLPALIAFIDIVSVL